jgi:6-phosphofructokinase 2
VTTEHKLRCTDVRRDAGGGAVNVARVLKRLGGDGRVLYPAGAFLGQLLQKLLEHEGIDSRALQIDEETRESFTVLEESSGREWRFVLPGPRLAQADWQACLDAVGSEGGPGGYVVASGSLPPGVPEDFYARLAGVCRRLGARMVLDASGPALAAAMEAGVYLVKPNLRELRELTGLALEKEEDWTSAAAGLVASGGAEVVALSLGHRGALLSAAGIRLRAPALPVKVASTVGAGDSFVAAMVWRLADGAGLEDAFRHGMAGGTAALLAPGTSLAHKPDVERLISEVRLHRSRAPEDDAALE